MLQLFNWLCRAGSVGLLLSCVATPGFSETPDEISSDIAEHMHEHFDYVSAIKSAVIAGDLEKVRAPAKWLATHEEPVSLPPVEEMRLYAARAAAAKDLTTAAAAASEIARTCGDCHLSSGVEVVMGYSEPPSADEQSLVIQMQRHLWAADRMWSGLIGPSDAAWKQGAAILAEVKLADERIEGEAGQQDAIDLLARQVQMIGEQARQAGSVELRSGLYGEFLSLCANCHQLSGGGPVGR